MRFSLATIAFETFELILCQMLSSQGKNAPSNPYRTYPHYLVRLATSREVAKKSVSARPDLIPEGTLGTRMGPGRAGMAPTSGPGWARNAAKQSTWRIWMRPLRARDETCTGPGSHPGEGLDGTPRHSNRRSLRLLNALNSEDRGFEGAFFPCDDSIWQRISSNALKCNRRKGKMHLQTPILTM